MQLRNSPFRYGAISVALHWLVAITVYGMFALGLWMVTLSYYDGWYHRAPELHKSIGIVLMLVPVVRLIWRRLSPPPAPLASYSRLTRVSAVVAHIALYLLLFGILFSGYLISTADGKPISVFGLFEVPATFADAGSQADPPEIFTCGWHGRSLSYRSYTVLPPLNTISSIKTTP